MQYLSQSGISIHETMSFLLPHYIVGRELGATVVLYPRETSKSDVKLQIILPKCPTNSEYEDSTKICEISLLILFFFPRVPPRKCPPPTCTCSPWTISVKPSLQGFSSPQQKTFLLMLLGVSIFQRTHVLIWMHVAYVRLEVPHEDEFSCRLFESNSSSKNLFRHICDKTSTK